MSETNPPQLGVHRIVMRSSRVTVTLYCGDCLDLLPIEADAVVSDPPYGMNWNTDTTRFATGQRTAGPGRNRDAIIGDDTPFDPSPWLGYEKVVLWGSNHYGQRLPIGTTLVWTKVLEVFFRMRSLRGCEAGTACMRSESVFHTLRVRERQAIRYIRRRSQLC